MSKNIDKATKVRLAWLTELRRQGHRQCRGEYRQGTSVCALGLLQEVAGIDDFRDDVEYIVAHAGLSQDQGREIANMNDGSFSDDDLIKYHKHTFSEIADIVEGWFK